MASAVALILFAYRFLRGLKSGVDRDFAVPRRLLGARVPLLELSCDTVELLLVKLLQVPHLDLNLCREHVCLQLDKIYGFVHPLESRLEHGFNANQFRFDDFPARQNFSEYDLFHPFQLLCSEHRWIGVRARIDLWL